MQTEYFKGKVLLDKYGLKSIPSAYVESADQALKFSKGNPIVLKVISEKALHKSKAGVVKVNLATNAEIKSAYKELEAKAQKLKPYKILAQQMSKGGIEIILGGRSDPQFGMLVLFGLGGIYVETFRDFALRTCPITKYDAQQMIKQLKSRNIVTYKGEASKMIEDILLKVSKMLSDNPDIKELDLNPAFIREDGYEIVDIRILR